MSLAKPTLTPFAEWAEFARSLLPGANMTIIALRDDAGSILRAHARDMQNRQSLEQQASKSKGDGGAATVASDRLDDASELHGVEGIGSGFHITDVVSEYRALRASVLRLWRESLPQPDLNDIEDITRFDESLDQSLARSVGSYSKRIDESRQMVLARHHVYRLHSAVPPLLKATIGTPRNQQDNLPLEQCAAQRGRISAFQDPRPPRCS